MSRHLRITLSIATIFLLALGLAACGGDDDPAAPPAGDVDTIAPLVLSLNPSYLDRTVNATQEVQVYFTEPMDPETVDVTLSSGGALSYQWHEDNRFLRVAHDAAWSPGEKVTATVNTGMKDLAGNPLPQSFSTTFYARSDDLMLLDTVFTGGQNSFLFNGEIVLYFSERMNLTSFSTNTTIEELTPPKAVGGLIYGTWHGDTWTVTFKLDGDPTPNTTYRITVDGSGARTYDGDPLGDDLVLTFTTGAGADETPPEILSVVPAVGSIVPTSTDKIVVTFSEPIDPSETEPTEMSTILDLFMSREPVWNDARDELTVYLQQPLPQGIRLYAIWDDNDFYDLVRNPNTAPDSVSFTTAGTADPFPVRDDLKLYYSYSDDDSSLNLRQTMENISGGSFERVLRYWEGGGFGPVLESSDMTESSTRVTFTGLDIETGHSECTPPVDLLRLPVIAGDDWEGSTTLVFDETTIVMDYAAAMSDEIYRERWGGRKAPSYGLWLDDCFDVHVTYSMTVEGGSYPFETGEMQYYFAPGLGIIAHWAERAFWDGMTRLDDSESEYYLWAASIDDRYDVDD